MVGRPSCFMKAVNSGRGVVAERPVHSRTTSTSMENEMKSMGMGGEMAVEVKDTLTVEQDWALVRGRRVRRDQIARKNTVGSMAVRVEAQEGSDGRSVERLRPQWSHERG
jgi:hypothetical protein